MNEKKFQTIFGLWINKTFSFQMCDTYAHNSCKQRDREKRKKRKKNSHSHRINIITAMIFKFWFKFKWFKSKLMNSTTPHSICIPLQQHRAKQRTLWFEVSELDFFFRTGTHSTNFNNTRRKNIFFQKHTHKSRAHGLCFKIKQTDRFDEAIWSFMWPTKTLEIPCIFTVWLATMTPFSVCSTTKNNNNNEEKKSRLQSVNAIIVFIETTFVSEAQSAAISVYILSVRARSLLHSFIDYVTYFSGKFVVI